MRILVTGCIGFIGSNVCEYLLKHTNHKIIGLDNFDLNYSLNQKQHNLEILKKYDKFIFLKEDITTTKCIIEYKPNIICHLASKAGVRNSINYPIEYEHVNVIGLINLLEQAKEININKFILASSSSVYGLNTKIPFNENDSIDLVNSPYAASKKTMEVYAKLYNQLYNINIICLRFFTVYGPRGRPDMAPFKFINNIMNNKSIDKYGNGESYRDYTFIDDIVLGIINIFNTEIIGFQIYNLGNNKPISLNYFIEICEKIVKKKAIINNLPNQSGDVPYTYADITKAKKDFNYNPTTTIEDGLLKLYNWVLNKKI
jgi:UDP-glucuronate 4-epimerase